MTPKALTRYQTTDQVAQPRICHGKPMRFPTGRSILVPGRVEGQRGRLKSPRRYRSTRAGDTGSMGLDGRRGNSAVLREAISDPGGAERKGPCWRSGRWWPRRGPPLGPTVSWRCERTWPVAPLALPRGHHDGDGTVDSSLRCHRHQYLETWIRTVAQKGCPFLPMAHHVQGASQRAWL